MKHNKKKTAYLKVLLAALLMAIFQSHSRAQEVFSDRTPSQEYLQNRNAPPGGMLKAGAGGTGTDDGMNTGTGTDGNPSNLNDAPVKDVIWLLCLLAVGYGVYRKRVCQKNADDADNADFRG